MNEALGFRFRQDGQRQSRSADLSDHRRYRTGASASTPCRGPRSIIDGNAAGQTPLANLTLPIGTHEVVFRHPQFPEQRQTVVVKAEGVTRVSATLQR